MVKGVSKRVIMVKTPEGGLFEQAIFLIKDEAAMEKGMTGDRLLKEACRVANGYLSGTRKKTDPRLFCLLSAAAGGGLVGAAWAVCAFFF